MKKFAAFTVLAAGAAVAPAQLTPFTVEAGWHWTRSVNLNDGRSTSLSGFEVGASQSLLRLPLVGEARIGGSMFFGRGGGATANVLRIFAMYESPSAGPQGIYGKFGFGYYTVTASSGNFEAGGGLGTEIGIGIPLSARVPGLPSPSIELTYRFGPRAVHSGLTLAAAVQF
jgi:hypothetical protein